MPTEKPPKHYLPLAFVVVMAMAGLLLLNPSIWFRVFDPATWIDDRSETNSQQLASAHTPLTPKQAAELFERYLAGDAAAGGALVEQDVRNGLPSETLRELELVLTAGDARGLRAIHLVEQLALRRRFPASTEQRLRELVRPADGGLDAQALRALGNLSIRRPLEDATLAVLLDTAATRSSAARIALEALALSAESSGMPPWTLPRLEEIARRQPGSASEAIRILALAGAQDRALALMNAAKPVHARSDAVAAVLAEEEPVALEKLLHDSDQNVALRVGAFERLAALRDEPERVGQAFGYAFDSAETVLRLAAFAGFSNHGRHHSRYIEVSWPQLYARAFADPDDRLRASAISAFRFVPFDSIDEREGFLRQMLAGEPLQQHTALRVLMYQGEPDQATVEAVRGLVASPRPEIAQAAGALTQRWRPQGAFEGLGEKTLGVLLLGLLALPAVAALAFETYFIAALLQRRAAGDPSLPAWVVSALWLVLSMGLGLLLFLGVLAFGHGGRYPAQALAVLAAVDAAFLALGWLLSLALRGPRPAD